MINKLNRIMIGVLFILLLADCNYTYAQETTPCEHHELDSYEVVEKPTIHKSGKRIRHCINCSYKYKWKYDGHLILVKNSDYLAEPYIVQYNPDFHYIMITINRDSSAFCILSY